MVLGICTFQMATQVFCARQIMFECTSLRIFVTSRVSGRGYKNAAVSVCVCVSVSALTAELFHVWSGNLV